MPIGMVWLRHASTSNKNPIYSKWRRYIFSCLITVVGSFKNEFGGRRDRAISKGNYK
jgi:hypothetical protein